MKPPPPVIRTFMFVSPQAWMRERRGGAHPPVAAAHVLDGAPRARAGIAGVDRVDDGAVLEADRLDEIGAGRVVAPGHPHRFLAVLLEELEDPAEVRVARRLGEQAVEGEVSSTPSRPSAALRSIAGSARRSAATCSRVARSAASAAVSASSARRTSRTCITSSIDAIRLRSSLSGAAGGAVT
jgi:hypothetical protein